MKAITIKEILLCMCLIFLAISLGNIVHEGIHILQSKGQVSEYCFLGNDGDGAVGWVVPSDQNNFKNDNYYLSSGKLSISEIWKYVTQKTELFPIISGYLITFGIVIIGLSYIFKKNENVSSVNKVLKKE